MLVTVGNDTNTYDLKQILASCNESCQAIQRPLWDRRRTRDFVESIYLALSQPAKAVTVLKEPEPGTGPRYWP